MRVDEDLRQFLRDHYAAMGQVLTGLALNTVRAGVRDAHDPEVAASRRIRRPGGRSQLLESLRSDPGVCVAGRRRTRNPGRSGTRVALGVQAFTQPGHRIARARASGE